MGTTLGSRSHKSVSRYTFVLVNHNNNHLNKFIVKTKEMNLGTESTKRLQTRKNNLQTIIPILFGSLLMLFGTLPASAHCDSYDGPVIKDASKALETNNVNLVLKWITK